jgi:pyruvate/2-oxoglutarate dehydrogenase complex dihydrolipoamide dehydrogenase (E3) component
VKTDVLVVGGGVAGFYAAITAKVNYPEKTVTIIRKQQKQVIPVVIMTILRAGETFDKGIFPDEELLEVGVKIVIGEAVRIDADKKICIVEGAQDIAFDKLVLATGSNPVVPDNITGLDRKNIFLVQKDWNYLEHMRRSLACCKKIIVVGGGFVGIEMAAALTGTGKAVTLIEERPRMLGKYFDDAFSQEIEKCLQGEGVTLRTGIAVRKIETEARVSKVVLDQGETLKSDAVILAVGFKPETALTKQTGIRLDELGRITTDQRGRTTVDGIYAIGDCAGKQNFINGAACNVMLASSACAEAMSVVCDLYGLAPVKYWKGTVGSHLTQIGSTVFGVTGLTEQAVERISVKVVSGDAGGPDHHPGRLFENTQEQRISLVADFRSGVILGGQVFGGQSAGELTNMIAIAVQNEMTLYDMMAAQNGSYSSLTPSAGCGPVRRAALEAAKQISANTEGR